MGWTQPSSAQESDTDACARSRALTQTHTHTRAHAHTLTRARTLARIPARRRACVRRAASSALWCAPYPLPLSGLRGGTEGDVRGPVRCLGQARLGRAPPSVPCSSLARPSGPWIKTIRTEQSGLDATFPPPTPWLKGGGGQRGEGASCSGPRMLAGVKGWKRGTSKRDKGPYVHGEARERPLRLRG